jgi:hypothetical protein
MKLKYRRASNDETPKEWVLRSLLGPASIIDGLFMTFTLAFYNPMLFRIVQAELYRANTLRLLAKNEEYSE